MSKKLRCAVVGVGYLGRFHAQKYAALAKQTEATAATGDAVDIEFVGVADADPARAKLVAEELGVKAFSSIDELLGKVDAVTIAASTKAHYELTKKFLQSGCHVNVEKPMTSTLEEGEEVVKIAKERGLILQVGHVERFNPALIAAREKLKKPLFIECHRLAPFKPRGVDVDVVLDLMIHDLDVILSLVKSKVKSVSAVGTPVLTPLVDIANARVEFESGTVANITASRVSQSATRKFRVFQERQYLSIDFGTGDVNLTTKTGGEWPEDMASVTDPSQLPLEFEHWSLEKGDALLAETSSFLRACTGEASVAVSGSDGLEAMRLAHWIQQEIGSKIGANV
ncbi:MAG: Gfo/Idh/MocA family oxidoreductase [Bdellovibrionales bacterium]|jgi:predicted dehydrogenase|nr:Gfo/Idh/MocA family oxidoreductase [Bdellovibrionales bacterium]